MVPKRLVLNKFATAQPNLPKSSFSKHCIRHEIFDEGHLYQLLC
jgi:hypothetical protein